MLSCVFNVLYIFLALFSHKVVKTLFVSDKTNRTTLFGINYCVEMVRIKTIVIWLKLRAKFFFQVILAFLVLFCIKLFKLALFCTKHGTHHYSVYIIVLTWLYSKTIVMYLKILAKLCFQCFLYFFGTFSYKVVQSRFVSHETWHTTLFDIN